MSTWTTRGFEAFRRGTFDNAGQNLYVSRAGVLQRIHLFDLDRSGFADLVFCNAQDHHEAPPALVYAQPLGETRCRVLPSDGAVTGVVADLNGDGLDDLVLGMQNNGIEKQLNAFVYFGSAAGWGEHRQLRLPAPGCTSVAAGDFNGNGKPDLAFACAGRLRVFCQTEIGFEAHRFVDLEMPAEHLAAADLDGDGYADLLVTAPGRPPVICWGGPAGLTPAAASVVGTTAAAAPADTLVSAEEGSGALPALATILQFPDLPSICCCDADGVSLRSVRPDRRLEPERRFACRRPIAVAVGRLLDRAAFDLVVAAHDAREGEPCSWVYPGADPSADPLPLPSLQPADVAVGDLDEDGYDEIVISQYRDATSYERPALVYSIKTGVPQLLAELPGHGARRVLLGICPPASSPAVVLVNQFSRSANGELPATVYWGRDDGFEEARSQALPALGAVAAIGCDVNDDSRPDLIVCNCAENAINLDVGSYVYLGQATGFEPASRLVLPTRCAMGLVIGDIDRDGYLEVIFSSFLTNELLVFHGCEGGFDTAHPQRIELVADGVPCTEGRRLCLADLNNDGWLDLVVTFMGMDRAFVLWGGPEGFDFSRRQALGVVHPSTPIAADLTGNGYLDLIVGGHKRSDAGPHDSFVHIYWNGPDGLGEDRKTLLPAHAVLDLALADFNGDGVLDLFVANYSSGRERDVDCYLYWGAQPGPGKAIFSPQRLTRYPAHSAAGAMAADFNHDGYIDLAVANHKTLGDHVGESWVIWNGPDGLDWHRPTRLPTAGPHGMYRAQMGNQRDRGPEEFYISEPFELPPGNRAAGLDWEAELPPRTWVRGELRSAATRAALAAAEWLPPDACGIGSWVQYRLALGARSGGTPRVREVRLSYGPATTD